MAQMSLSPFQINHYYDIFNSLLKYVNLKTNTLPKHVMRSMFKSSQPQAENVLRAALWSNAWLLDAYIKDNPHKLNLADLEIVRSWKDFRYGDFTLCKVVRGQGIFSAHDEPRDFYAVYPLFTPFDQLLDEIPIFVKTAIIPYENVLIYDGSIASYAVSFGSGLRKMIQDWYINAKELDNIKTSFRPMLPLSDEMKLSQTQKTNKSVLRYFKKYLKDDGKSEKITNRDSETAQAFATYLSEDVGTRVSLREITKDHLLGYISTREDLDKATMIGLRRFLEFLANTDRMDWDLAEELLFILRTL